MQYPAHPGADTAHIVFCYAQRRGDIVGGLKAHSLHAVGEYIGIVLDAARGVRPQHIADLGRHFGRQAVFLQEDDGSGQRFRLLIGLGGLEGLFLADALYLRQPFRLLLKHQKRIRAEFVDYLLRRCQPYPRYQPRGEIGDDIVPILRRRRFVIGDLKL